MPPVQEGVDESDSHEFLRSRIREALESIPDRAREAFLLFRFEGMTTAQVA